MDQLGQYKILNEIGRGGMGVVYRAVDPFIGRPVAIKVIYLQEKADPGEVQFLRERLFREAQSAGSLSHPGIVTIYQVAESNEVAYIAMEFVNGPSLDEVLNRGLPLSQDMFLRVIQQTAAALDYAHSKAIVHRDIKPGNLMVHEDGTIKICDFGVAKIYGTHKTLTQAGFVVGTPNYMGPEQLQGKQVDGGADQYSLGVMAYELLGGRRPFVADTVATLILQIMTEEPQPVHELNLTLEPSVSAVVVKALAKRREQRYATCSEFAAALTAALNSCIEWRTMPRAARKPYAPVSSGDGPLPTPPSHTAALGGLRPPTPASGPTRPASQPKGIEVAAGVLTPPSGQGYPLAPTVSRPTPALTAAGAEAPLPQAAAPARGKRNLIIGAAAAVAITTLGLAWYLGSGAGAAEELKVLTHTLPEAAVAREYRHDLEAAGGRQPHQWEVVSGSLPGGLGFDPDGLIRGTPQTGGSFAFTARVRDAANRTASRSYTLSVRPEAAGGTSPGAPAIAAGDLAAATVGLAYNAKLRASGAQPMLWSLREGGLPPGLSLDPASGTIGGVPQTTGSYRFTAGVRDAAGQSAERPLVLRVEAAGSGRRPAEERVSLLGVQAPDIITAALPPATVGSAYAQALNVTQGNLPHTWSISSGALPPGLALGRTDGAIRGTPSRPGEFEFELKVTDQLGLADTRTFSLRVSAPEPETPAGPYYGPLTGTLQWSGQLDSSSLTVAANRASAGDLRGRLPGVPVDLVEISPPQVTVAEPPSAANRWTGFRLECADRAVARITIRWRIRRTP